LHSLPEKYRQEVNEVYNSQVEKTRSKLLSYFIEHKLKNLIGSIEEF